MDAYIQAFIENLNGTFIMCYCFFVYGIKNIEDMKWYNTLFDGTRLEPYKILFAGLIIFIIQCILHYMDFDPNSPLDSHYIAQLLRSWIFSAVLYNAIIKKIKLTEK